MYARRIGVAELAGSRRLARIREKMKRDTQDNLFECTNVHLTTQQ